MKHEPIKSDLYTEDGLVVWDYGEDHFYISVAGPDNEPCPEPGNLRQGWRRIEDEEWSALEAARKIGQVLGRDAAETGKHNWFAHIYDATKRLNDLGIGAKNRHRAGALRCARIHFDQALHKAREEMV